MRLIFAICPQEVDPALITNGQLFYGFIRAGTLTVHLDSFAFFTIIKVENAKNTIIEELLKYKIS